MVLVIVPNSRCCQPTFERHWGVYSTQGLVPADGGWMGWCPMSLSLARKTGDVRSVTSKPTKNQQKKNIQTVVVPEAAKQQVVLGCV
jgi:hypothetical protein